VNDPTALLDEARERGLVLLPLGENLRVIGPLDAAFRERLRTAKPALLVLLHDEWREVWEERAGILEFDAGLPRDLAERLATIVHPAPPGAC
jgi:hypothetical protein